MAIGDDALAAGMDILTGNEQANTLDTEENKTRDYIAQRTNAVTPVAKGGTGAESAAAARTNLDVVGNDQVVVSTSGATILNKIPRYDNVGRLAAGLPAAANHVATKAYVDGATGGGGAADGPTSAAYARNAAGSGWFVVYMNSALQFMRNTSSRRYKKNIRNWAGSVLDLRTVIFDRRGNDTPNDEVGFIAEEVEAVLPEAAMYFDGKIDGINDRVILAAAVADLQRLAVRVNGLEAGHASN